MFILIILISGAILLPLNDRKIQVGEKKHFGVYADPGEITSFEIRNDLQHSPSPRRTWRYEGITDTGEPLKAAKKEREQKRTLQMLSKAKRVHPYPLLKINNVCLSYSNDTDLTYILRDNSDIAGQDLKRKSLIGLFSSIKPLCDDYNKCIPNTKFAGALEFNRIFSSSTKLIGATPMFRYYTDLAHIGHYFTDGLAAITLALHNPAKFNLKHPSGTFLWDGSPRFLNYLKESEYKKENFPNFCKESTKMSSDIFKACLLVTIMKTVNFTPMQEILSVHQIRSPMCIEQLILGGKDRLLTGILGQQELTKKFISNIREVINEECELDTIGAYFPKKIVLYGCEDNKYGTVEGMSKRNRSARFIININETIQALENVLVHSHNFEYVPELNKLSFCEQMRLFARAKVFISPEGAHLTLGTFVMNRNAALLVIYGHCKGQIKKQCPDDSCTGGGIAGPIWFTAAAHFNQLKVKKLPFCLPGKYSNDDESMTVDTPKLIYELQQILRETF